jgi:cysteinyl-tRNA synthetase, unknown class
MVVDQELGGPSGGLRRVTEWSLENMRVLRSVTACLLAASLLSIPAHAADRPNPFAGAKTWGYQLRNRETEPRKTIAASPYDLVVIDFARGEDRREVPLTKDEVAAMQTKTDGSKRLVIAYLSIGETENYRYYWKPEWDKQRPSWMGKENKEWKANYLAKYWEPEWQKIVYDYVDRVLDAGFDGFYFDRVDAYYYYGDNAEARGKMVKFVTELAKHVRAKKPNAAIMVQNAEELLDYKEYVASIDGIAKESLLYGIKGLDVLNPRDDIDHTTNLLKKAKQQGKEIFIVEYLQNHKNIETADKKINGDLGFALYVGTRGLATLGKSPLEPAPAVNDGDDIGATKTVEKKKETPSKPKRASAN